MLRYVGMFDFLLNEKYIWRNAYNVQSAQQRRLTLIKCIRRRHLSGIHCIFSSGPISNTHPPPKNNRPHKFEGTTTVATAAATAAVSKYFFLFLPSFLSSSTTISWKSQQGWISPPFPPFLPWCVSIEASVSRCLKFSHLFLFVLYFIQGGAESFTEFEDEVDLSQQYKTLLLV